MQTTFDYRTNRDLFSNHYLDEQLPETEEWNAADEAAVREAYEELDRLYREQSELVDEYNERQLRENLLDPVFEQLGLTTAVEEPVRGEQLRPDYTLFGSERAREDAFERRSDGRDFHANALAVADAKRWGQSLDGHGERDFTNPSYQIHVYLDATGLDRGILTNGRRWRLYYGPTSHRLDSYYEIDLPALLETGDPEEFKYFYLFFRREAFLGDSGGTGGGGGRTDDASAGAVPADHFGADRPFVERVHRRSNVFAEELSEDLRENVYEALTVLAEGFVADADDLGREDLDRVYEACLTYLYRLIFVLYAESDGRDLLDTDNDLYRKRYSLNTLKRRVADELDSPEPIYREWQTTLWDRLHELFTLVDSGSEAQGIPEEDLYIPAYNGGLFKTEGVTGELEGTADEADGTVDQTAAFLQSHAVGDAYLARVIDLLTRRDSEEDDESARGDGSRDDEGRVFVDYSSLDVRHLGSIYEGLLEYDLEIAAEPLAAIRDDGGQRWVPASEVGERDDVEKEAFEQWGGLSKEEKKFYRKEIEGSDEVADWVEPGDVYLTTETGKRKTTGSYYTPEFVVEYVVERTLDPLLDEIRADLDPADPDYAEQFAERIFDLSILDPAMGSGHFLVKTVDYLARAVVQAQQEQVEPQQELVERTGSGFDDRLLGEHGDCEPLDVHWARRQVAKQCIYGVDENGMAVELAKVSLWLRTLAAEQPLAFLDHHLKQGDSLAGTDVEAVETLARDTGPNASLAEFGATRADAIGDLMDAYREFVAIENETLSDVREMERRYDEIRRDDLRRRLTAMANVRTAERFGLDAPSGAYERMGRSLDDDRAWQEIRETDWFAEAQRLADERDFFHWKLTFPEVFYEGDGSPKAETEAGFDAVVGNPPYVRSRNLPDELKEFYRREFRTAEGAYDLYVPFVELAADLGRRVSLVVPNKWTTTEYGRGLRDLLLDDHDLREVLDASNLDVFPDADIYPVVLTCERGASDDGGENGRIRVRHPEDEDALSTAPTTNVSPSFVDRLGGRVIPLDLDAEFAEIAARVLSRCDRFGDHVTMSEGVHTGNVREKLLTEDSDAVLTEDTDAEGDGANLREVVGGDSIGRYRLDWDGTYLRYDESLVDSERGEYADLREPDVFEGEKLLVRDISDRPVAVYDAEDHYALNTLYSVRSREDSDRSLRYLLGAFNSEFAAAYYRQVYGGTHVSGDYLRFKPMFAAEIPVPDPASGMVGPAELSAIVASAGVEDDLEDSEAPEDELEDPEAAVATLTERLREANDERTLLNLDVLDYLPNPSAGDSESAGDAGITLAEVGVPVEGVGESILAETADDREGLRIGEASVNRERDDVVLSLTARYKPAEDEATDRETDRWGYVETDPVPAMRFPDRGETATTLIEAFVPAAVERGGGFASFRKNATKTNSLLDRLRALILPNPDDVAQEVTRFREVSERAEELDERIEALEAAIDQLVYRLYGLDEEEIALVERLAE